MMELKLFLLQIQVGVWGMNKCSSDFCSLIWAANQIGFIHNHNSGCLEPIFPPMLSQDQSLPQSSNFSAISSLTPGVCAAWSLCKLGVCQANLLDDNDYDERPVVPLMCKRRQQDSALITHWALFWLTDSCRLISSLSFNNLPALILH